MEGLYLMIVSLTLQINLSLLKLLTSFSPDNKRFTFNKKKAYILVFKYYGLLRLIIWPIPIRI